MEPSGSPCCSRCCKQRGRRKPRQSPPVGRMKFPKCMVRRQTGAVKFPKCMVRRLNAREKLRVKKVCVNVFGLLVESYLLAMMRYAAYLSCKTPRLYKAI